MKVVGGDDVRIPGYVMVEVKDISQKTRCLARKGLLKYIVEQNRRKEQRVMLKIRKFCGETEFDLFEILKIKAIRDDEDCLLRKRINYNCFLHCIEVPKDPENMQVEMRKRIISEVERRCKNFEDNILDSGVKLSSLVEFWNNLEDYHGLSLEDHFYPIMDGLVRSGRLCRLKKRNSVVYF